MFGWTQDDGATQVGPDSLFQSEEDIKKRVQQFAHTLSDQDFDNIFSLYPADDFAYDVDNYNARKEETDPSVSVHWFRASAIVRDLLFTCSSIEFGFEIDRQSRALDPDFKGVRLYDFNQTMLDPLFKGAGMPYLGVVHGSDVPYLLNGIMPEVDILGPDQKLSSAFAESFLQFAYTGNPGYSGGILNGFASWPEAFPKTAGIEAEVSEMNIQVIGGPYGTGSSHLHARKKIDISSDGMQMPMADNVEYNDMESEIMKQRSRELERQKLFERCEYFSSISKKLGR